MKIDLETVLYGVIVYLGAQAAVSYQLRSVQSCSFRQCGQLCGRLPRMFSFSTANINAQLMELWVKGFFKRAHHRGCNSRRMPVHAHYTTQCLKPERVAHPGHH